MREPSRSGTTIVGCVAYISQRSERMTTRPAFRFAVRLITALLIASPFVAVYAARTIEASGYVVAYDGHGEPTCAPGGTDDCPT